MKLNYKSILIIVASIFFSSCATIKDPKNLYSEVDYTLEDVRKEETKRITELLDGNSVQALWRASLMGDEEVNELCWQKVLTEFNEAVSKEDYYNAKRLYDSMNSVFSNRTSSLSKTKAEIEALYLQKVPGFQKKPDKNAVQKVSAFINGTVTIWVDKGIKIENGIGYADRVIGSGFFISNDGYIITNNHVIADVVDKKSTGYSKLYIKLAENPDLKIPAKVIGWDPQIDLALLKTEVDVPYVFSLGSSSDLEVGNKIYAIGSPVGLERTLTSGIVSANDRKLFSLGSVLQIDAAVNSGNSGGPCIDENGNVQAVVFAGMLQFEGLNFAIPVEYLKSLLPALKAGGKINHPWLGCYGHTKKDLGKNAGVEVQYCLPGGSASRAKLKSGDVITHFDGKKVNTLDELQDLMMGYASKSIYSISYVTPEGEEKNTTIYLSVRPEEPGLVIYKSDIFANAALPLLGMKLNSISTISSRKYAVEKLLNGSLAEEYGFSENDPLEFMTVKLVNENKVLYVEVHSKNRKKGYLDVNMAMSASLDSPYYF